MPRRRHCNYTCNRRSTRITADDFLLVCHLPAAIPDAPGGSYTFGIPMPLDFAIINPANGQISGATEGASYEIVRINV